jgi:hypothetical protein
MDEKGREREREGEHTDGLEGGELAKWAGVGSVEIGGATASWRRDRERENVRATDRKETLRGET